MLFWAVSALAQNYPSQPIKVVVPFTPGTGMDNIARIAGRKLSERLGQPVVVENRPGASGNIGADVVAKSAADGHTLMVTANTMLMAASMYKNVPFDAMNDFAPITLAAYGSLLLTSNPKAPFATVPELIAKAKASPGKLTYASPGIGTPHHLAMELFKDVTGTDILHVPYKGSAGAVTDLLSGQVDMMFFPIQTAYSHVKAGKLRALAVGSAKRHQSVPEVPTLKELGVEGVEVEAWYAFFAPKNTPQPIVARLNSELRAILAEKDVREILEKAGLDTTSSTPEELRKLMDKDFPRWAAVIKKNNISAD
jgi:tripartite-type tricarboxylate transporter receptor subunit TctC